MKHSPISPRQDLDEATAALECAVRLIDSGVVIDDEIMRGLKFGLQTALIPFYVQGDQPC